MKTRTLKKALSLFLAVLMIALALPLTMLPAAAEETDEATPASIKYAKMFAKYSDGYDLHALYGSVAGMIDGDKYDEAREKNSDYPYFYSREVDDGAPHTTFKETTYYGYALFELDGMSALDDVTIWLASDGHNETAAATWSDPTKSWNMNNAYDIFVSEDGETWTSMGSFSDMCGTGSAKGAGWSEQESLGNIASDTKDGYQRLGHKVALNGASAKYVVVAVKECNNDTNAQIVIGEVTVNGTVTSATAEKNPAEIYAEAKDGAPLKFVNFHDTTWSDDYADSNNWDTYAYVSDDGKTVKHLITGAFGTNNKRAMWGGIAEEERFSLDDGSKYTIFFDAQFGRTAYNHTGYTCVGIQIDGDNTLLIDGNGYSYWYQWNNQKVGTSDERWSNISNIAKADKKTFAVEVDPVEETMTLYVANSDGSFAKVRTLTYDGADIKGSFKGAVYVRSLSGSPDGNFWVDVSDIKIYKGLCAPAGLDRAAEYANANAGDLLETVNFKDYDWNDEFASSSNSGATVEISEDGSLVKLTELTTSSKRAMWGGIDEASRFPLREVTEVIENPDDPDNPTYVYGKSNKYTLVFDVKFGKATTGSTCVGIQIDGDNTLLIDGNGYNYWYTWNTKSVDKSSDNYERWNYISNVAKANTHTFAVEIDPEKNEMTLYVANMDGSFGKVRTLTYNGNIGNTLKCAVYTRALSGTPDSSYWMELSDLQIYKGFVSDINRDAEYENAKEGDLLNTIDFSNRLTWNSGFVDDNNEGADVDVIAGRNAARLTVLSTSNKRAMWGGFDDAYTLREVTNPDEVEAGADPVYGEGYNYTIVFDVDFGNTTTGKTLVGIQVGGDNAVAVDGYGYNYLYQWNTVVVDKSDGNDGYDKWHYNTDRNKADKQTFAVEVDPNNGEMILYVQSSDGTFNKVRSFECTTLGADLNCRVYVKGTVADDSWAELSNVQIYKGLVAGWTQNVTGASVRIDNPTGIRFSSEFRKPYIDSLRATYGEENVKLGMIITPTDYLTSTSVEFEMAALDACEDLPDVKYVKIDATAIHDDDDSFYTINCALVNVNEGNYNREFSARAFIEVNGEIYKYADFDLENNSRSIAYVARAAYGDVKNKADEDYKYPVVIAGTTVYSPYDADELKTLTGFFTPADGENEEKQSSITVLSYNLEYKRDDVWEGRNPANAVQTILDANPDVVGIQEDTEDWNSYLTVLNSNGYANLAGNRKYNKYTNKFGNGWAFNDIYYKTNKFTLVSSGWDSFKNLADDYTIEGYEGTDMSIDSQGDAEGWFSDEDIGRTFSYAVLQDKTTGEVILFVNTHLHYGDGTGSGETYDDDHLLREYQSRLLAAWLADEAAQYPTQILTGDMNAHVNSSKGKVVLNGYADSGLSFARNEALIAPDTGGTLASSSSYDRRDEYVFDHVLFRNAEALEYTVINNMVDVDNTRYPSDHLPVYAKFVY